MANCDNNDSTNKLFLDCAKPHLLSSTPTKTPSKTPLQSRTPTKTVTPTKTITKSITPTSTPLIPTPTRSPTRTPSSTNTTTPYPTSTPTNTSTPLLTQNISPTPTQTSTSILTNTPTLTTTPTLTRTPTTTVTPTKPFIICFDYWSKLTNYNNTNIWTDIASNVSQSKIIACSKNKQLHISTDSGNTWAIQDIDRNWTSVACSDNFSKIYAAVYSVSTSLLYSEDDGLTWRTKKSNLALNTVSCSSDGSIVLIAGTSQLSNPGVYISTNSGDTWIDQFTQHAIIDWTSTAMNNDGSIMYATNTGINNNSFSGYIYKSTNTGSTWSTIQPLNAAWTHIDCSSNGTVVAVCGKNTRIYVSNNGGFSWNARETQREWLSLTVSSDGTKMIATAVVNNNDYIAFLSVDSGITWKQLPQLFPGVAQPYSCNISSDGQKALIGEYLGEIHSSSCSYILNTSTPTPTNTQTPSLTPTISITPTITSTPGSSVTPSITPSKTPTRTVTPTKSITPTASYVPTFDTNGYLFGYTGASNYSYSPLPFPNINLKFIDIACGLRYTIFIGEDNRLYGHGDNNEYKISTGLGAYIDNPTLISNVNNWIKIKTQRDWNIAKNDNNELYIWGNGYSGTPTKIDNQTWLDFDTGWSHGLAINSYGELYGWGSNADGQLGIGSTGGNFGITKIGTSSNWISVAAGSNHSLAINSNGELYGCGGNTEGQLSTSNFSQTNTLQKLNTSLSNNWKKVFAGYDTTFVLDTNNRLFSCGRNVYGELGHSINSTAVYTLTQVGLAANWSNISASMYHTAGLTNNGEAFIWGYNRYGQLGNSQSSSSKDITQYRLIIGEFLSPSRISAISAGYSHTVALTSI